MWNHLLFLLKKWKRLLTKLALAQRQMSAMLGFVVLCLAQMVTMVIESTSKTTLSTSSLAILGNVAILQYVLACFFFQSSLFQSRP